MKKLFFILTSIFIFLVIFSSCQKEEYNEWHEEKQIISKNAIITNNPDLLNARIFLKNQPIPVVPFTGEKENQDINIQDHKGNYRFVLKADVAPPVFQNIVMTPTQLKISGNYVFISYKKRGDNRLGGVEIMDMSDSENPGIISQAIFPTADISAVDYANGKLYISGTSRNYSELGFDHPAFMGVLSLNNKMEITGVDTIIPIIAPMAKGIKVTEGHIFVTGGPEGYLTVFDLEYNRVNQHEIDNARSVAACQNHLLVLAGMPGRVYGFDIQSHDPEFVYETGGAGTPAAHSEIAVCAKYIYAALNEEGMKVLNRDGSLKQHIPKPPTPGGHQQENHLTSSLSKNLKLIFLGNGDSGVSIGESIEALNDSIVMHGVLEFQNPVSVSFVESRNSMVFVASPLGGMKILSITETE